MRHWFALPIFLFMVSAISFRCWGVKGWAFWTKKFRSTFSLPMSRYNLSFWVSFCFLALFSFSKNQRLLQEEKNALGWRAYIRRLSEGERKWPGRIILLKFEDLLQDLPGALATEWEAFGVRILNDKELSAVLWNHRVNPIWLLTWQSICMKMS